MLTEELRKRTEDWLKWVKIGSVQCKHPEKCPKSEEYKRGCATWVAEMVVKPLLKAAVCVKSIAHASVKVLTPTEEFEVSKEKWNNPDGKLEETE